jgi:predicted nucleotidyltransferase
VAHSGEITTKYQPKPLLSTEGFFFGIIYLTKMRLLHINEKEFKQTLLGIIGKYLDTDDYKIFIFGSRVTGKGDDRSDIDIGIEGPKVIPLKDIVKIEEEIEELPTLYSIDIVDFTKVSKDFQEVAKEREYLN